MIRPEPAQVSDGFEKPQPTLRSHYNQSPPRLPRPANSNNKIGEFVRRFINSAVLSPTVSNRERSTLDDGWWRRMR
jgi:hypothetical protein